MLLAYSKNFNIGRGVWRRKEFMEKSCLAWARCQNCVKSPSPAGVPMVGAVAYTAPSATMGVLGEVEDRARRSVVHESWDRDDLQGKMGNNEDDASRCGA